MSLVTFTVIGILTSWMANKLVEEYFLGTMGGILVGILGAFVGANTGKAIFRIVFGSTFEMADLVGFSAVGAIIMITFSGWFLRVMQNQKLLSGRMDHL